MKGYEDDHSWVGGNGVPCKRNCGFLMAIFTPKIC